MDDIEFPEMSTINQIQLPNGSIYGFEDTAAREAASSKADKTLATTSADGLMSKEDKAKLDGLSDSGIHYVPFKLVDDTACSTTDSFDTVVSMLQANKPVQASVNADGKTISLPVFMYDAGEIMFRNDEMYIIWVDTSAFYGYTLSDKLQDNDTTETSGQAALDAHMGKVLSDRINAVKTGAIDQLAKNTAQIETAGTATNAHSVGEYVMISNALYKVTASVAKGDTWTIGTNVTAANIGSEISSLKSDLADKLYPVGSIYLSVNATNPATLFGGTWEQIKDRFLLAAGDAYAAGSTGGEATHTHKYGFQYGAYFGSISMERDAQSGSLQDGTGNPVGSAYVAESRSDVNNNVAQAAKTLRISHYKSIADTSSASNMPPYLGVYMWKRTA